MESKNYICGGNTFAYSKGYIGLPIEILNLPETIEINGETLLRKTSFHISLICVKDIVAVQSGIEEKILSTFCSFVSKNDISFSGYTGEFRFAQDAERKSFLALCEMSGLSEFFHVLRTELGLDVPDQPTHITLYTLQPNAGIGLNSPADMEGKSVKVEAPKEVLVYLSS